MGEAKRRKQLGLMPTVFPFEAELTTDGQVTLLSGPQDPALAARVQEALARTQLSGAAWESDYRSARILSGAEHRTFRTAQDVASLPVPGLRRLTGDVVLNQAPGGPGKRPMIPFGGGGLRLRGQQHSFDGQHWESSPDLRDVQQLMRRVDEHPAFALEGERIGQFRAEQWAEGRIDIDPEPPEGTLEVLEDTARWWHGQTPEQWLQAHQELTESAAPAPSIKRSFFELRRPAPLRNPRRMVLDLRNNLEILPLEGATYTYDGETWLSYDNPDTEPQEDDFLSAFGDILNMETVQVTVRADGRVEWDEGEIEESDAERVRQDLRAATGAGDPAQWAAWSRQMLLDTFNASEADAPGDVPVPQAVRLDLPKDAVKDPDPLAQTFIESEVTFDGEQWRDLYDEEVPQELLLALASIKPSPEPDPDQE